MLPVRTKSYNSSIIYTSVILRLYVHHYHQAMPFVLTAYCCYCLFLFTLVLIFLKNHPHRFALIRSCSIMRPKAVSEPRLFGNLRPQGCFTCLINTAYTGVYTQLRSTTWYSPYQVRTAIDYSPIVFP